MFKNFNFSWPFSKKERLFKVAYRTKTGYGEKTLLVTGKDTISAVKKFYRIVGIDKVENIIEFTEINYDKEAMNSDA